MRICLDYRPALREGTGVGTYVLHLLAALARNYPDDEYTAFSSSWKDRLRAPADSPNVVVSDWPLPVRALDWGWHRWGWPPVERLVGKQDIAHSPSPMLLPARTARQVVTVHDCYFLHHPEDVFGPVRRDYVPLARKAALRADAVLVPSATTAAEVEELLAVPADKIHVTPLGVDPRFHRCERSEPEEGAELRARFDLHGRYLLFVGRREPRKDLGTLLAAVDELAARGVPVQLAIVGPEAPGWQKTWSDASPRARDRCRLLPHLPAGRLAHLYAGAAAAVIPSRWEGFGLTALEAMAAGTPVIAARVGALPEVLSDAPVWVPPGDAHSLAEGSRRILEDPAFAEEHRRRGMAHAGHFRWEKTAELTHSIYRRLLD